MSLINKGIVVVMKGRSRFEVLISRGVDKSVEVSERERRLKGHPWVMEKIRTREEGGALGEERVSPALMHL